MVERNFFMVLQKTDVGFGQTTPGKLRRPPETFIPLAALKQDPGFWGWTEKFRYSPTCEGKLDRKVLFDFGGPLVKAQMMTWPLKHDFRIICHAVRDQAEIGDILHLGSSITEASDYQATIIKMGSDGFDDYLDLCTNPVKNSYKRWGYLSEFDGAFQQNTTIVYTGPVGVKRTVVQRVGQARYRRIQLEQWGGKCALTGIENPRLLRASHAKPWASCDLGEHLNPYNGFLLAAHIDAAFDAGLITFDDNGSVLFSADLSAADRDRLGIASSARIVLRTAHLPFLRWHRQNCFDVSLPVNAGRS